VVIKFLKRARDLDHEIKILEFLSNVKCKHAPIFIAKGTIRILDPRFLRDFESSERPRNNEFTYIVMEQFGPSAFDKMDDIIYSEAAIIKLGVHIMDSLENLHQAGYAHNDIKQANITIGRPGDPFDGRARLIDYGVAEKLVTSDLDYYKLSLTSKETDFKGNILMTTNERLRGYPPTRRDDLVNLILMLIFMLDSLPYSIYYFIDNKSE